MADFIECLGEVHNENISLLTIIQVLNHELLLSLNPSKAPGPDKIKPRVLKELATEIAPILTIIFQISLESGVENTDLNWSFTTFAFAMGSVINLPSCFNDEIP
jgi:hypothetical protein